MKLKELSNIIIESILLENRVKDVKKKYPQLADGTGEYPIIDYFVANDPSGNNKYLEWMVKAMLHKPTIKTIGEILGSNEYEKDGIWGETAGFIKMLVGKFHNLLPYLVHKNDEGEEEGTTDLYQYKFTDSEMINYLIFDIEQATERKRKKDELEKAKKESDKIYADTNWLVVRPRTWESSCVYGAGTKWCTTNKSSSSHFVRETKDHFLFYVINRNLDSSNITYKVAWQIPFMKDYSEVIYDDGTINQNKIKLWNAEDNNFVRNSTTYIESIPIEVKLKIKNYMQSKMDVKYENMGYSEDPYIQALTEHLGLSEEDVDNIETADFTQYGMTIYTIESSGESYAVGTYDDVENAKREWAEQHVDDLGYEDVLSTYNPERYIYINDARYIAQDYAESRIGDLSDEEVLEEAKLDSKLKINVENWEVNKGIFESNEEEIDELESADELTEDEEQELKDLKLENEELKKDLEKDFKYIRNLLYEEFYESELYRLETDPLDWLWEMGYYNKKSNTFDKSVFKNRIIGINHDDLIYDMAEDLDYGYFSDDGEYSDVSIMGENYYIFSVSI